jgi:SDR family mycofactocin-dependent oxidoreductase
MSGKLAGKVALVTGAARGQGRSHAIRLAEDGADIIAIDLCASVNPSRYPADPYKPATPEDLAETARLVNELDRRIVTAIADVRDRSPLHKAIEDGVAELGGLHVVVANAGICPLGSHLPTESYLDVVSVNLVGVLNTVEAAFPHLSSGASIVITGSLASRANGMTDNPRLGPGGAGYSYAKKAVGRFVHQFARQCAPSNIRVNAVHPGNVRTDMLLNQAMFDMFRADLDAPTQADAEEGFAGMHLLPYTYVEPRDISNAIAFLASNESRMVTGLQLGVDAGALLKTTTSNTPD